MPETFGSVLSHICQISNSASTSNTAYSALTWLLFRSEQYRIQCADLDRYGCR